MENEEYEYNEGSDIDNWEDEQVFQDHEERDEEPEPEPREDFGFFGEMGMMED
tara:strand:+ start:227 stop:385 length:159 start_codon:yes stop_codon:yes gene_type:complete